MTRIGDDEVDRWLETFAACVRDRDLDAGRALFAADAAGFGTVAGAYRDRDELVAQQWSDVWPRTADFSFSGTEHRWLADGWCAVAATWTSVGLGGDERRTRSGRATLVLRKDGDRVVAVHSHFSMAPGTPA